MNKKLDVFLSMVVVKPSLFVVKSCLFVVKSSLFARFNIRDDKIICGYFSSSMENVYVHIYIQLQVYHSLDIFRQQLPGCSKNEWTVS